MLTVLRRIVAAAVVFAAAVPSKAQTCSCTCDNLVPQCMAISRFYMNESGGSPANPTMYLSAGIGTVPPTSAEVRHANRFAITPGTTLTHVCIALKNPSGPASSPCAGGDSAYIFLAVHDTTTGLPGAFLGGSVTNFIVDPCIGTAIHHQLVAFSTPQVFPLGADIWVGVGYPTADVNIGHQGNRPRTGGQSAVWIGGTLSRWYSYEDPQLPPFNGRAPIIRGLELVRGGGRIDASPAQGLFTDENGATAQFQVVLASAPPLANVTVSIGSSNPSEGQATAGSSTLVFTPGNWNIPQIVTVVGQDDTLVDGNIPYQIVATSASADPCYDSAGANVFSVNLTNIDNDGLCDLRWTNLGIAGPPAREFHAMAFDPVRNRVVLYGGVVAGFPSGDLWEFDPVTNTWASVPQGPGPSPGPRYGHAMAFDASSGRVMLVGGTDNTTYFNDAWAWNGLGWTALPPPPGPGRRWHAMASLPPTGGVLLCGGQDALGTSLSDAAEFFGGGWLPAPPMTFPGPTPRAGHSAAAAHGAAEVYIYGGLDAAPPLTPFGDTWTYIPGGWNAAPFGGQAASFHHAMASFGPRPAAVLFGGTSGPGVFYGQTQTVAGPGLWAVHGTQGAPAARSAHAMAAMDGDHRVILFGGSNLSGALGDTWELSDPTYPTITATGDINVDAGQFFTQAVTVTAPVFGSYTYQWYHNGTPLSDNARINGSQTATLTIGPAVLSDWGQYWAAVTSVCGPSETSAPAIVDVLCTADFNHDHVISVQDIFDFLNAWFAGDPRADVCAPAGLQVQDIFCFLNLWFAGCP
ncbi:MAG TPA: kelch repeat-containing protein [Phycisphaerales bacterium]|nr:kelch repeat-containing protein [Phycisphaerales bacterium]